MPQQDLERELDGDVTAQRLLDALPRLAENGVGGVGGGWGAAGGMPGGGEPSVEIEDGGVFVHNSVRMPTLCPCKQVLLAQHI
jgi:hypothetical protein